METQSYKRTLSGSVGAGVGALFNGSGRTYYILEHKTKSSTHSAGESQKIIVDEIELGRAGTCQVRFGDDCETVSRRHAAIQKDGDRWKLIPLSQTNGTYVNGNLIQQPYYLNSGDEIKLSSNGPVMGFIQPQGAKSLVNSIGLTERMSLFRQQALRPYKTALWIMGVVLVLSVGGLMAYNVYQKGEFDKEIANMTQVVDNTKKEVAETQAALDAATKESELAKQELDNLKSNAEATAAQIRAAEERAANAERAASAARATASAANSRLVDAERKLSEMEAPAVPAASSSSSSSSSSLSSAAESDFGSSASASSSSSSSASQEFANITDCYDAIYYIKMNNVEVYDNQNQQIVSFNTEKLVGGTGFMLEDGRFVSARRVIEPWFYFQNTRLGTDSRGDTWYFEDIQLCINEGYKVVANYTAYSKSGANFQFRSTDMRKYPLSASVSTVTTESSVVFTDFRSQIYLFKKKKNIKVVSYNAVPMHDWATMMKRDQLSIVNGLPFSNNTSLHPQAKVEVAIVGYPLTQGFTDSQSINPLKYDNMINVTGLNDENVIELSSRRWKVGNDGAPVLQLIDGQWTVIGILSHTDSADRDNVTPIQYTKR